MRPKTDMPRATTKKPEPAPESDSAAVNVQLFGKPAWEANIENQTINPTEIRDLGDALQTRLHKAAEAIAKLQANGWDCQGLLYDVMCTKPITKTQADKELAHLDLAWLEAEAIDDDEDE